MEMVSGNRDFYRNQQLLFHWLAAARLRAALVDTHQVIPRRDELQVNLDLREALAAAALAAPDLIQGDVRALDFVFEFDFPAALVLEGARVTQRVPDHLDGRLLLVFVSWHPRRHALVGFSAAFHRWGESRLWRGG